MKHIYLALVLLSFTLKSQVNPINNVISMDINMPQNASFNYDSCFAIGKNLGIGSIGLFQIWNSIETSPLNYNFTNIDIANLYYPAMGMPLDLTLAPINTHKKEVPSDLMLTSFSSTVMIARFNRLLDSIKVHTPNLTLSSLIIGSEHDVYMGSNATLWSDYNIFYNAVMTHAKALWPGLKVATELTFDGITTYSTLAQTLNTNSDYVGVSYYPLNANFTVKSPTVISVDFATLVSLFPTKKINFYQFGYPSSTVCASSDLQQKQFITQAFTTWDIYAANVRLIDFTWLHDLDPAAVSYYSTYYGITNPAFLEYLRTLGLRTWPNKGTDKPALSELRCQAKARGFNTLPLTCSPFGVDELTSKSDLGVYPNPASDWFKVGNLTNCDLKMYDVAGKLLFHQKNYLGEQINVKKIERGMYFVIIEKEGEVYKAKLLIE